MAAMTATAVLALAGCGGDPGDLLSIEASGGVAGGKHTVVVSGDGRGSCDRGPLKQLPADRVIDARGVERDAGDLARRAAEYPARQGARRYVMNTKDGEVRWSERTPGLPSVLPRAQLLQLQLQRLLCG
jgi:outer membrane protein assembly factor BamB